VPERDDAQTFGLRHAAEIRDRDARHVVDVLDAVELERVDDEVKAVRQFLRVARGRILPADIGRRIALLLPLLQCRLSHSP
jgi:hypothetical protein